MQSGDVIDKSNQGQPFGDTLVVSNSLIGPFPFDRDIILNGTLIHVPKRSVVLVFDHDHWDKADALVGAGEQTVYVHAVDDLLDEGTRTVVISHSVLSDDDSFDHALVRNVEVTLHDNDHAGILVTQLDPFTTNPVLPATYLHHPGDNNTVVLEGDAITEVTDLYAIELEKAPTGTVTVAIKPNDSRVFLTNDFADSRFHPALTNPLPNPPGVNPDTPAVYYVTFDSSNWNIPVFVTVHTVPDGMVEDPHNTTIFQSIYVDRTIPVAFARDAAGDTITRTDTLLGGNWLNDGFLAGQMITVTGAGGNNAIYELAGVTATTLTLNVANTVTAGTFVNATFNLDSLPVTTDPAYVANAPFGDERLDVQVLDDDSSGVFLLETAGKTLVSAGSTSKGPGPGDSYTMRLTQAPTANVNIDIVTDGQTDINPLAGDPLHPISLVQTGGVQPIQLFSGNITISGKVVINATITSGGDGHYTSAPTITFSSGGASIQATGTVDIDVDTGLVVGITIVTPGVGYSFAPIITFNNTGSDGTGAAATANLGALITRASGSELGSFFDDGFVPNQRIRIEGAGAANGDYLLSADASAVSDLTIAIPATTPLPAPGTYLGAFINMLQERGVYATSVDHEIEYQVADGSVPFLLMQGDITIAADGMTVTRTKGSFINDNFAPGQKIRIVKADQTVLVDNVTIDTVTDATHMKLQIAVTPGTYLGADVSKLLDTLRRMDGTSWLDSGFFEGQLIQITGIGGTPLLEKIDSIVGTDASKLDLLILTDHPASPAGPVHYSGRLPGSGTSTSNSPATTIAIAQMAARVTYTPPFTAQLSLTFAANAAGDTITRSDGGNWLADGFASGHTITIGGATATDNGTYTLTGVSATTLTLSLPAPVTHVTPGTFTKTIRDLDTGTWFQKATIPVIADPYFDIQPGHENLKSFPKRAHRLNGIRGPLAVEGGTTSANREIIQAVILPGEANAPVFQIAPLPPGYEALMIDALNIYNDGTKGTGKGTLTSSALTGFEMGADLDFTSRLGGKPAPFGEPAKFPGGISYGSISLDALGNFNTDGNHSTIEVLNVLLGAGNDRLDILSTLVPGVDHDPTGAPTTASLHGGIASVHGGGNALVQTTVQLNVDPVLGAITRTDGLNWADAGFAVGQQVLLSLSGGDTGSYTVARIGDVPHKKGSVLFLNGTGLTAQTNVTGTIAATDWLQVTAAFDILPDRIVRRDGLPWASLGYAAGQQVSMSKSDGSGVFVTRTVIGFDNSIYGMGSALVFSAATLAPATNVSGTVAVTNRNRVTGTFSVPASGDRIDRAAGAWADDGFAVGQAITINGLPGTWTVTGIDGAKLFGARRRAACRLANLDRRRSPHRRRQHQRQRRQRPRQRQLCRCSRPNHTQ